jgi:hypothetical protein
MMFVIGKETETGVQWLMDEEGRIVQLPSKSQCKEMLRHMGLKRKDYLIVPVDMEDFKAFLLAKQYSLELKDT